MKHYKKIPHFKNEEEESEFWNQNDSSEYIDWSKGKSAIFPNLKPSTQSVSIRLPVGMIESLKVLANKKDVPYQSLMKVFLSERVSKELRAI